MKTLYIFLSLLLFLLASVFAQTQDDDSGASAPKKRTQITYDWGSDYDSPKDMVIDKEGNYAIVGFRDSIQYLYDAVITRLTPSGQTLWFKTFPHSADTNYYIWNIVDFPGENAYLFVVSGDEGKKLLTKMDYSGNIIWQKQYSAYDVQLVAVNDSMIVVAAGKRPLLITFDLEGNEISRTGISPYNGPKSITLHGDTLLISGWFYGKFTYGNIGAFIHLLKWNPDTKKWDFIWKKELGDADDAYSLFSRGYIYVGMNYFGPYPPTDSSNTLITRKYTMDGDLIWERMWNGEIDDNENRSTAVRDVASYPQGGITVFGTIYNEGGRPTVVTYADDGTMTWWMRDLNNGNAAAETGAYDENYSLIVVERASVNKDGVMDVILQKYDIPGLTTAISDQHTIPSGFELKQNYPNPFNARTVIEFYLPVASIVSLEVFNSLGQRVEVAFDNRRFSPGSHKIKIIFDAEKNIPSGVYFYKLQVQSQTGSFSQIKKMVLIK